MKLTYFFLSYAKADRLAFHQANNLWAMTCVGVTRWFKLHHGVQRADSSLNRLRVIQDGARRGQQLACERNSLLSADAVPRRCERGALVHPRDRVSVAMEDTMSIVS